MNNVELSLIVPVFNGATYLREFVRSLSHQNVGALEIILVDDGSTDGSSLILDEIAAADSRVVILRQSNAGSSAARNAALRIARGQWITFADCDDVLVPGSLGARLARARALQVDVLVSNGFMFSGRTSRHEARPIFDRQPWDTVVSGWKWIRHAIALNEWPHYVWLQLIRRDLIVEHDIQFEEGILHQDILWTISLALTNSRFAFTRDLHYGYRRNPVSVTNNVSQAAVTKRAGSYVRVLECIVEAARRQDIDASVRRALLRLVNRESRHFYGLLRKKIEDTDMRGYLAQYFLSLSLQRAVISGSRRPAELWHALRCVTALYRWRGGAPWVGGESGA